MKPAANAASTASRSSAAARASRVTSSNTVTRRVACELVSALSTTHFHRREPQARARSAWRATKTHTATKSTSTATFADIERAGESMSDIATTGRSSPIAP